MNSLYFEKAYGALAGRFIGRLFGRATIKGTYREYEKKYGWIPEIPNDKIQVYDRYLVEVDNLTWKEDQDTYITEMYVSAYKRKNARINIDDLSYEWLNSHIPIKHQMDINNIKEVLMQGMPPRLAGAFSAIVPIGVTSVIPIGIYNAFDSNGAYIDAEQMASISQRDQMLAMTSAFSACIAEAMKPDASVDSVIDTALKYLPDEEFIVFDERLPKNPLKALEKALLIADRYKTSREAYLELTDRLISDFFWSDAMGFYDMVCPLPIALAFLKLAKGNFKDTLLGCINFGVFANIAPGLAGAIAGTLNGVSSIPAGWLEQAEALTDFRLKTMAGDMATALYNKFEKKTMQLNGIKALIDFEGNTNEFKGTCFNRT